MKWSAVSMESFDSVSMGRRGRSGEGERGVGGMKTRGDRNKRGPGRVDLGDTQVTSQQTFPKLWKKQHKILIRSEPPLPPSLNFLPLFSIGRLTRSETCSTG
jgi:hypothetical protein